MSHWMRHHSDVELCEHFRRRARLCCYALATQSPCFTVGRGDQGSVAEQFYSSYNDDGPARLHNYTHAEFASLFGDLELVPPGIGQAQEYEPGRKDLPPSPKRVAEVQAGVIRVD